MGTMRTLAAQGLPLCALVAAGSPATQAAPFELLCTGSFDTHEALNPVSAGSPTFFAGPTAFTVHALFDTGSPNLAPPLGGPFTGFRAYSPISAEITFGGTSYSIQTAAQNPQAGVTVAIFDGNSLTPGRYGIGMIANPAADGSGFVGDFGSASPPFTASSLVPTVFGDFFGVGRSAGPCSSGSPPACPKVVTPWVLSDAGNTLYNLAFADHAADFGTLTPDGTRLGPLNTARWRPCRNPPPWRWCCSACSGWPGSGRVPPRRWADGAQTRVRRPAALHRPARCARCWSSAGVVQR